MPTDPPPPPSAPSAAWSPFIHGLGLAQIISWGTLFYAFPLIAGPMGRELGLGKPAVYGMATFAILVAGLAAFPVGSAIDRGYGRAVMTLGSVLSAGVLLAWSRAESLAMLYLVFAGVGLAQACTTYEPVFAVIVRRYGPEARRGITAITLWGGFASTAFVPLTQWWLDAYGWRGALLGLALCNLACVALNGWLIDPRRDRSEASTVTAGVTAPLSGGAAVRRALRQPAFWGLLVAFTVYYGVDVGLVFHLYPLLLERGFAVGDVIAALAIIGPAQVAGRVAMWLLGRDRSVRAIGLLSLAAFPLGLLLLLVLPRSFATVAIFGMVCGASKGVTTIVRGLIVPEVLSREAYGAINGALAFPASLSKAIAPAATAALWALSRSYDSVLDAALASFAVVLIAFWFAVRRGPAATRPAPA